MKETIKKATSEEVAEQKTTTKKDKNIELTNELSVKKAELAQNILILNGGVNKQGQTVNGCDKLIEMNIKLLEMKELENKYRQVVDPKMRYEREPRWQQLRAELEVIPLISRIKKSIKMVQEQKKQILETNPTIQKRIKELEKEIKKKPDHVE